MFSKAGIIELHATMHERLDLLLRHVATVPHDLHHKLVAFSGWREEDCPAMAAMLAAGVWAFRFSTKTRS
jgi:hypothetical protein